MIDKKVHMRFSLIIGTLNRHEEIKLCLESISKQNFKDFEVVIVDQSKDELTRNVVNESVLKCIKYRKVEFKGLSRARNEALKMSDGEFFCLIDDDAYYPEDYLYTLDSLIKTEPNNRIFSGYMWNSIINASFVDYSKIKSGGVLSTREVIRYCPSPCITFPMRLKDEIGLFDEKFGVGSTFGSCEETDYLLRAMDVGYTVAYYDNLKIIHPHEKLKNSNYLVLNPKKINSYALGFGALARKHIDKFNVSIYYLETVLKDVAKIILKSPTYKYELKGHLKGFIQYKSMK